MKNRKIVVVAFTLIAVLLLGVGYAAVTDDLSITATVKTNLQQIQSDFQDDVRFLDGSAKIITDETNGGDATALHRATAYIDVNSDYDDAVITVTNFTEGGQTVQAMFTIVNYSTEFVAEIAPALTADFVATGEGESHTPVFSFTWEWCDEAGVGTGTQDPVDLEKYDGTTADTVNILVTITLDQAPDEEHSGTFTLGITATSK